MPDYEYTADLDLSNIATSLKKIDQKFDQFAKNSDKAFKGIASSAKTSGVSLDVVSGVVSELTGQFLRLANVAISSLINISKEAVRLNASIETADKVFDAAFGDPKMGEEVIKFLDETAERFNINKDLARQFGQSILPKTDSTENFIELLRLTDIQADVTGKSVKELEFAIREALGGDFVSLKDQFDISKAEVDQIKALTPELGAAGALAQVLGENFEKLGKVNIQGTLNTDLKAVGSELTDLQTDLGKPIFEELKNQVADLGGVLNERGDDFALMAGAVGDVVANVVDFVGSGLTDFLENLDTDQVIEIANNFLGMVESGRNLVEVLGLLELPGELLDQVETLTSKLTEAFTTAVKIAGLAKAEIAKRQAEANVVAERSGLGNNPVTRTLAATGLALGADEFVNEADQAAIREAGEKAYREELLKTVEVLDESKKRTEAVTEAQKKRREEQGKETEANTQAIDDFLRLRAEEEAAAKAAEDLAKAQEKVNEKMDDLKTDQARAELDALIKAERAAVDAAVDAAREREKIALKNQQAIEDIARKNEQAVIDAGVEAGRDEADAAREGGRSLADISRSQAQKQIDIARQAAQKKADIETQYRRKIQEIAQQFSIAALDAERSRDAVAFLAAKRERDLAFAGAGTERDQGLADVGTETGRQQEEARIEAERAREEARIQAEQAAEDRAIENERKMEDLRAQLTRELEEQRLANEQEIEEQRLAEERKQEDLTTARARDEEDLKLSLERKRADLEKSLADEVALIKAAEAQKTAAFSSESQRRIAIAKKEADEMRRLQAQSASGAGRGGNPLTGGPTRGFPGRAAGGPVGPPGSYMVGEQGRELFTPSVPGYVTPNNRIPSSVPAPAGAAYNRTTIDNSQNNHLDLIDPTKLSAIQRAMLRNEVAEAMAADRARNRRAGQR